jgi:hypothetical protein
MNGACAWLSLGNEYCDEILETQKVITQLTNNWNELEEYLNEDDWTSVNGVIAVKLILDKMKEIKEKKR